MARATEMGLIAGGCGYSFVSTYPTKGCYTYSAGSCKDKVFYGFGGTAAQEQQDRLQHHRGSSHRGKNGVLLNESRPKEP